MQHRLLNDGPERSFVVVLETGDEVVATLERFADEHGLMACRVSAIGAVQQATLGYFDWERKDYVKIPINEQVEVLSFIGDIALKDGKPKVHAHVVVGKRDGTAHGGHLLEAFVRPTLEVVLIETPAHLRRTYDEASKIALIDLDAPAK